MRPLTPRQQELKATLDSLYDRYLSDFRKDPARFFVRRRDPLLFPHRYSAFCDIEAAAFLAATFAYGNVSSLCAFIESLLGRLRPSPGEFLRRGPEAVRELASHKPYYRLHKQDEILALLRTLAAVYARHGSLYELFTLSYDTNSTMRINLSAFTARLREIGGAELKFLVPSPESGSTCKRLLLFLRWMVRRDGIDFGLWRVVPPAQLVMPVDTHIGRVARRLRWIRTPSLTWQKAEQITDVLRRFDPDDPVRYDFSLCHESMDRRREATTKSPRTPSAQR